MRRLQKPVWMLNYNGEGHGLRRKENRLDFARRMQQFFDHHLKAALPSDLELQAHRERGHAPSHRRCVQSGRLRAPRDLHARGVDE